MPDILHRISIDAPQEHVHDLIATTDGVARWWTGRPAGRRKRGRRPLRRLLRGYRQARRSHGGWT